MEIHWSEGITLDWIVIFDPSQARSKMSMLLAFDEFYAMFTYLCSNPKLLFFYLFCGFRCHSCAFLLCRNIDIWYFWNRFVILFCFRAYIYDLYSSLDSGREDNSHYTLVRSSLGSRCWLPPIEELCNVRKLSTLAHETYANYEHFVLVWSLPWSNFMVSCFFKLGHTLYITCQLYL